jgi:hypothetical protein
MKEEAEGVGGTRGGGVAGGQPADRRTVEESHDRGRVPLGIVDVRHEAALAEAAEADERIARAEWDGLAAVGRVSRPRRGISRLR